MANNKKKKKSGKSAMGGYNGKSLKNIRPQPKPPVTKAAVAADDRDDIRQPLNEDISIAPDIAVAAPETPCEETEQLSAQRKRGLKISMSWAYRKRGLAIISLILSFFMWCMLTMNVNTTKTKVISDVPIRIDTTDLEETSGLQKIAIVDPPALSKGFVDVTVHGTVYQLSQVTPESVTVTAQVSGVSRSGESTLGLVAGCTVRGVTVAIDNNYDFIKVWFDRIKQRDLKVEKVVANGAKTEEENLIIGDSVSTIKSLSLEGPESIVELIDTVRVYADVNKTLEESFETQGKLRYYNADGTEITDYQMSFVNIRDYNDNEATTGIPAGAPAEEDIKVIVPVSKTAKLPLELSCSNIPEGFNMKTLSYTLEPKEINIEGDVEAVNKYIDAGSYSVESIDLSTVSLHNSIIRTKINLSSGIEELSGVSDVTVRFNLDGYEERDISIGADRIKLVNADGVNARVMTDRLDVHIIGPKAAVNMIGASECVVTVDMSGTDATEGQRKLPASISFSNMKNCWTTGSYMVMVDIETAE